MSLPRFVFVHEESENSGAKYLQADYTLDDATGEERRIVGVYKLCAKREVKQVVKVLREIKVRQ